MSYYAGDFYQGDPGFLSGFAKLAGFAGSFIPGIGGVVSKGAGLLSKFGKRHPTLSAAGTAGAEAAAGGVVGGVTSGLMQRQPAGLMRMPGSRGAAMVPAGATMRGFHMSKPYKCHGVIVPSHPVRNRRMRVTNPRALRRAVRRAKGFERIARKVMHFVSPRKTKGRAVFRARKRRV